MATDLLIKGESPLQFQSDLAVLFKSSDRATILQQIYYWIQHSNNIREGHRWVYNSYAEWQKQFPWLSVSAVKSHIQWLEKHHYLITGNFNKAKFDRTKWYRLNYDVLNKELGKNVFNQDNQSNLPSGQNSANRLVKNNSSSGQKTTHGTDKKAPMEETKINQPIPIDYTIDYQETNTHNSVRVDSQNKSSRDVNSEHQNQRNKEIEEMFTNQIWNKYPKDRCGDFKKALNGFKNALKQDKPKTIIEGISNYIDCKRKANTAPRYWAILANLLNQRLYINDYSINRKAGRANIPYWQQPDYQPLQVSDEELAAMNEKNHELMKKLGLELGV